MMDLTNGLPELGNPKNGFTRSGIHTREYGMWLVNRQAPTPSEKQIIESVPFMQGVYDFSNILGERVYENRSLTYVFEIKQQDYEKRKINQTAIENWLKKDGVAPLYDDHARGYYYMAKCTSVNTDDFYGGLRVTTTWDAYPFKISELPEGHDIWDEFNFELDVAIPSEIEVNGTETVNLYNIGMSSKSPKITTTAPMSIIKNGITYNLPAGEIQDEAFRLMVGDNNLTIVGNGTIKFEWYKELL